MTAHLPEDWVNKSELGNAAWQPYRSEYNITDDSFAFRTPNEDHVAERIIEIYDRTP